MIPINLLDGLVERFKKEFAHLQFKDPKNPSEYKKINVFPQHLPAKNISTDISLYPYLCIRLNFGGSETEESAGNAEVLFIAGVYDKEIDNQGFRDAISIVNKVYQSLLRNPVINEQFELNFPIRWTYQNEDSEPYYLSGLETNWEVPKPVREDVEGMI